MSKFKVGETYRTRDGREAKIYATDGAGSYPIHGAIDGKATQWLADGKSSIIGAVPSDIMPPRPEPIRRKMWVNVYDDGALRLSGTPASARANADDGVTRIAVPVMVTEIEDEQ